MMNNACVVFLIDEAPSMQMRIADGTHSKIDSISTAVNSAIRQMEGRPPVDVAVIGYHRNASGASEIGSRFGGVFTGRTWVSSEELTQNPIRIENRTKQMVNPVTHAITPISVEFPIWFEPVLGPGKQDRIAVFEILKDLLQEWTSTSNPVAPPLVFSFLSDLQPGESIANSVVPLGQISSPLGFPMLFQFHAGTYANVPAIKYPTAAQFLPYGPVQELFFACSPLNEQMVVSMRQNQEFPSAGAKGLVYNGRMIDMVRMLSLLKMYQSALPMRAPVSVQSSHTPLNQSISPNHPIVPNPSAVPNQSATPNQSVPPGLSNPSGNSGTGTPNGSVQSEKSNQTDAVTPSQSSDSTQQIVQDSMAPLGVANLGGFKSENVFLEPCPPIQPISKKAPVSEEEMLNSAKNRIQMPDLLSKTPSSNSIFNDFDKEEDEDDSLVDIPSVENLPDVKAEIIPAGFRFCCEALPENKPVHEPDVLLPRKTLLILLVDRSVSDLTYRPAIETWNGRLEKTRFMLGEIARRGRGCYDVSLIFYGKEADGSTSVASGTLGKSYVSDSCLYESAGRVESMMIQIPNGIGGLISLPRKKLSFTNCSPTYSADPVAGFERVVQIVREWDAARPKKLLPPIVLHITSGKFQMDRLDEALLQFSAEGLPPIQLQHWIFTERPHVGVCCPSEENFTKDEVLQALWERTDPLPAREFLAGIRPGIHEESRGMMVNMDFDLLFEVIDTLAKKCENTEN